MKINTVWTILVLVPFISLTSAIYAAADKTSVPNHTWVGPFPGNDQTCPDEFIPVYDKQGNRYPNVCEAAKAHIRNTWDSPPRL